MISADPVIDPITGKEIDPEQASHLQLMMIGREGRAKLDIQALADKYKAEQVVNTAMDKL